MNIKEIFETAEGGTLTFEQFETAMKEKGAKFTDLSEGKYVSKSKYDDDLGAKDKAIEQLNGTIGQRDKDLADLKTKLEGAGTDATKLAELQNNFNTLQTKYDEDMQAYQKQLASQKYEFAVKEFANNKEFTSQAAKRDFIRSLMAENLKMKDDAIIGAEDFTESYIKENSDAFIVKSKEPESSNSRNDLEKPQFVSTTPGGTPPKTPTLTEMMMAANDSGKNSFL